MSTIAIHKISGIEFMCKFTGNQECVSIEIVGISSRKLSLREQLIPHGLPEVSRDSSISERHQKSALNQLQAWIQSGDLTPASYDPTLLSCSREDCRAYARFWSDLSTLSDWGKTDVVNIALQSLRVSQIISDWDLSKDRLWYLTETQRQEVQAVCQKWRTDNAEYLQKKAVEFSFFWSSKIGVLGSSGDGLADAFHALSRQNEHSADVSDVEKFAKAVYDYAIAEFARGSVPFLDTDYGVGYELAKILKANSLEHLKSKMPWKTWLHLDFSDAPPLCDTKISGSV